MNDNPVSIMAEPTSAAVNGWAILKVKSVGANMKRKQGTSERTVWATLEVPEGMELKVATPLPDSVQADLPQDVVTLDALERAAQDVLKRLETVLINTEENKEGEW